MKNTLRKNIALALLAVVSLYALGSVHAAWSDPTTAPDNSASLPITPLLAAQEKQGGLSVGVFAAAGWAQFNQQTFFRDVIKGVKSATDSNGNIYWTDAPLRIGGTDASNTLLDVEVNATGTVKTLKTFGAGELRTPQDEKKALCADETGHIVFCPVPVPLPPSFDSLGDTDAQVTSAGGKVRMYGFLIGPNMVPGTKYSLNIYNYQITVTSVTGDTASSIVDKFIDAINNTTVAQWRSPVPNSAPANGTPGFPPKANRSPNSYLYSGDPSYGSVFGLIMDYGNTTRPLVN